MDNALSNWVMEVQFRAVPWATKSCGDGAIWPRIAGELQQSASDAIKAGLTFALGWRARTTTSPIASGWVFAAV